MTQLEVDPFDAPEKPFKLPESKGSSEPGEASQSLRDALLGSKTSPEKADEETEEQEDSELQEEAESKQQKPKKQDALENYSAKLQPIAEELYETLSYKAKTEEGFLEKLLEGDATERKFAKKILERNAKLFGASSPEEYVKTQALKAAGDDPTARKLAELEIETKALKDNQRTADWDTWKTKNGITGDFAVFVDEVKNEHPNLPYGDIVSLAKGRVGHSVTAPQKPSASFAAGGSNPSETEDVFSSPLAKAMLPNAKKTKKFAKDFLRTGGF